MIKILSIIGSPRKKETYNAVGLLLTEIKKLADVEIEHVFLRDLALQDCVGCHKCFIKGETHCPEHQAIQALVAKMEAADAVILATPVYNSHVSALMKKFFDYTTYLWHRPALFGKEFFGVSSGGGYFKPVFKYMKTNVSNWGGTWAGELGVPHYESLQEPYQKKLDKKIAKAAQQMSTSMQDHALPRPGLGRLMWFNMWRINAQAGKGYNPTDYAYWQDKGWFDNAYYYNYKGGHITKGLASLATRIMRWQLKKVYKGY